MRVFDEGDSVPQDIWTCPAGVSLAKEIAAGSSWHVKPNLDSAVIPAARDVDGTAQVHFIGTRFVEKATADLDNGAWTASPARGASALTSATTA